MWNGAKTYKLHTTDTPINSITLLTTLIWHFLAQKETELYTETIIGQPDKYFLAKTYNFHNFYLPT